MMKQYMRTMVLAVLGLTWWTVANAAERIQGSVTETAREVIDELAKEGEKVGLVKVHLYRPFSAKHLLVRL